MALAKAIGQENTTSQLDVPRQTNGDQIQCKLAKLKNFSNTFSL